MIIRKIKIRFKGLFLLAILLVVSGLAVLIGKVSPNKNSNPSVAQSGLINSANADSLPGSQGSSCGSSGSGSSD